MPASDVVLAMLRGYVSKTRQVHIRLPQFVDFVKQYAESYQHKHASLRMFLEDTQAILSPVLTELADDGKCSLEYEGDQIGLIVFNQYLLDKIRAAYSEIDRDPTIPFPSEESLKVMAPPSVTVVNIKNDFVKWLSARPEEPRVLRLTFPENLSTVLVTSDLLERKLLDYSVMKIRDYLGTGSNSGFMLQRLKEVFALKDQVLQSMLREIVTRPTQAVEKLLHPTEFSFTFWAHLASAILKEFRSKKEKLPQEHGYCQACYLVGLYNVYHKGLLQRDRDIEQALKSVDTRIKEAPFYFTVTDVYAFRDEKGVPLTKRCPRAQVDAFLERLTHAANREPLPEVVRLGTPDGKEYLIHRTVLLGLTLNKISGAARQYADYYTGVWYDNLGDFRKTPVMLRDEDFRADLAERVEKDNPLLHALLSFNLLYLCRRERGDDDEAGTRIDRILDLNKRSLVPLDEVLGLSRRDMLTEARLKLPLWKTIPLFKHLFHLFDNILGGHRAVESLGEEAGRSVKLLSEHRAGSEGRSAARHGQGSAARPLTGSQSAASSSESAARSQFGPYAIPDAHELGGYGASGVEEPRKTEVPAAGKAARKPHPAPGRPVAPRPAKGSATAKQRTAAYRKAVGELVERIVGSEQSLDDRLKQLTAKWNPLLAEKAKRNLVEDVNSFVRDQVRFLKRSLLKTPPDLERVENLSTRIAENSVFEEIRHKEEFQEYIKLYLIKVLGRI